MREEYRRELEEMGPDEVQLVRLKQMLTGQGTQNRTRKRAGILRPALVAAVLAAVLVGTVCATVWQGWLGPVVNYGDNGALVEEYTLKIGETREGEHCDVTLENLVTDGMVLYCLFSAEYDEAFDIDTALRYAEFNLDRPSWMVANTFARGSVVSRVDDGSQKGHAEFIARVFFSRDSAGAMVYYVDEDGNWIKEQVESLLGRVFTIRLDFYDGSWAALTEEYSFTDVRFNDTIDLVDVVWDDSEILPDGTKNDFVATHVVVSPLSVSINYHHGPVVDMLPDTEEIRKGGKAFDTACREAFDRWYGTDWFKEWDVRLVLADGTYLRVTDLTGFDHSTISAGNLDREVRVWLKGDFLFHDLRRPESITAVIIDGVRYEINDARS